MIWVDRIYVILICDLPQSNVDRNIKLCWKNVSKTKKESILWLHFLVKLLEIASLIIAQRLSL